MKPDPRITCHFQTLTPIEITPTPFPCNNNKFNPKDID
jgi:hypothetical protein